MKTTYYRFDALLLAILFVILLPGCKQDQDDDPIDPEVPVEFPDCGTVTDADGNVYQTVVIGSQCWMRQNLQTSKYKNGDLIGTTAAPNSSIVDEENPKYEWVLEGNSEYLETYGRIYTWYAATDPRGLCPQGWHLPSDNDWQILEMALGMSQEDAASEGSRGNGIGSKLAANKTLWNKGPGMLVNHANFGTSGFDGLPGGARNSGGAPVSPGFSTYWWSSTLGQSSQYNEAAFARYLVNESSSITRVRPITQFGLYVRCVKD